MNLKIQNPDGREKRKLELRKKIPDQKILIKFDLSRCLHVIPQTNKKTKRSLK